MFSRPYAGWVHIKLDAFEFNASYITNVPLEVINALVFGLEANQPTVIHFDGEGLDAYLVIHHSYSDAYTDNENIEFIKNSKDGKESNLYMRQIFIGKGLLEIAEEVLADFKRDLEVWEWWMCEDEKQEIPLQKLRDAIKEARQ